MVGIACIRLRQVVRTERIGMIALAVILGALFVLLAYALSPMFFYVVSGELLRSKFDPAHVGGALDQPSLTKMFFWSVVLMMMALPFVSACRSIANRTTRLGRALFTIGASSVCAYVMTLLAIPFWWTVQYIGAMGVTRHRIEGLIFSVLCYAFMAGFLWWAVRKPRARVEAMWPVE